MTYTNVIATALDCTWCSVVWDGGGFLHEGPIEGGIGDGLRGGRPGNDNGGVRVSGAFEVLRRGED